MILASASPRRRELLRAICPEFTVMPSGVEETLDGGPYPAAEALALRKAQAIAAQVSDAVVLGADTLVVIDGDALGKPAGPEEARAMLRRLRARLHEVVTGIAVVDARTARACTTSVTSRVLMAAYPDSLVDAYVTGGAPFDKAGAYAIQDLDGGLVAGVVGSYTNVVGLPLGATGRLLAEFGVALNEAGRRWVSAGAAASEATPRDAGP